MISTFTVRRLPVRARAGKSESCGGSTLRACSGPGDCYATTMGGLLNRHAWRRRCWGSICRVQTERKVLGLTFDDGPAPATPEVLDILRHYRVPAAFFVVGAFAEKGADTVRRLVAEGHELGNHTQAHETLDSLNAAETWRTLRECDRVLAGITGIAPRFRRPCYGAHTPAYGMWNLMSGRTSLAWSRDGADWLQPPAEEMLERIMTGLAPGDIVLLHDGTDFPGDPSLNSRRETVRLLPRLIEAAGRQGYEWVGLGRLLRSGTPRYVYWEAQPPQPGDLPKRRRR